MHIPAKVDYGMRALLTLAESGVPATVESLAIAQGLPAKFLGSILNDLRRADIVVSQRGAIRGYRLSRPPDAIVVADVIRALDGPLAAVRGLRPESIRYDGAAAHLQEVWVALRASIRSVLEGITLEDVVCGRFSHSVACLMENPQAWKSRPLLVDSPTPHLAIAAPSMVAPVLVEELVPEP
jgi:Rrf2 family protein